MQVCFIKDPPILFRVLKGLGSRTCLKKGEQQQYSIETEGESQ